MQGLLLINKPAGMTSFAAVARVRRLINEKRVGHTGTLDPMATGVLPVLIGRATALSGYLLEADKRYTATVKLGLTTDTEDITGTVLSKNPVCVDEMALREALTAFCGEQQQVPPMYSALKKDGVPLYKLARKGETVERKARTIVIHSIDLLFFHQKDGIFCVDVCCSKGTYIRSLCRDIGAYLGCGAVLTDLCRTQTGNFCLQDCLSLESADASQLQAALHSEERAVAHLPAVSVTRPQGIRFSNGGALSLERLNLTHPVDTAVYRVYADQTFLGLGEINRQKEELSVRCVMNNMVR